MTIILKPGDRGIDFSGAKLTPASVKKNGGTFILRYSAGAGNTDPSTQWKLCGPHEIAEAVAAGLDFIANSEWYEGRVTEGAAAGHADGLADLAFWKSHGLAKGASVYVSWDADPVQSKWSAADAYLEAHNKAMGGYYHSDCYAGTPYLRHALAKKLIRYGWRPNAGSWSGDNLPYQPAKAADHLAAALAATPAHIWQTGNYWFSKSADEDMILRVPVGSHLEALHPSAPAKPQEDDMDEATVKKLIAESEVRVTKLLTRRMANLGRTLKTGIAHGIWTKVRYPDFGGKAAKK